MQNKDPDHVLDMRVEAQKLFNKHNPHLNPDNTSQTEEVYQEDYGPTHLGLLHCRQYIYSQYGGAGMDTAGSTLTTSYVGVHQDVDKVWTLRAPLSTPVHMGVHADVDVDEVWTLQAPLSTPVHVGVHEDVQEVWTLQAALSTPFHVVVHMGINMQR